jgi:uncharacterized protein (TIGR03437 family)
VLTILSHAVATLSCRAPHVSANQINAVAPMELTAASSATIKVTNGATSSAGYPVWIVGAAPQASSAVLNQDGSLNSQSNPAKSGSIVTFYVTGWQPSFAPLADGQVATSADDVCQGNCRALADGPISVPGGNQNPCPCEISANATVLYGGAAPDIVAGVSQFNIQLGAFSPIQGSVFPFNFALSNFASVNPTAMQTFAAQSVWVTP